MTDTPNFDEIPVLTEVVAEQAGETEPLMEAADAPAAAPVDEQAVQARDTPAPSASADDDAWSALEERLVTRVLDRLQPRIDVVLEDQVRDQMAIVLDHVAERMGAELRAALQQSIEQVVARAVEQELAHLNARQA